MRLLLLALRNLGRNRRRTLVTALAVVFGGTAVVFLQGFANGFIRYLIESTVQTKVGAIQVFRKGYIGSDDPLKRSLPYTPELMGRIAAVPGVSAVAPRIDFDGMMSNGSESAMFVATAIDPGTEYQVCPLRAANVAAGSRPLSKASRGEALIGQALVQSLGAKQGAVLVMQSAGPHAGTNALDVEVAGYLPTRDAIASKRMATVPLAFAQDLLRMKGQVTEYVVAVSDLEQIDAVAGRLRDTLGGEYDVLTWRDMEPLAVQRMRILRFMLIFIGLVLFLLVATGIVNTMLMSVYERVREIGTMLAVGVRRRQVRALFLWESISLGLLGAMGGAGIGWALVAAIARRGVTIRPPGGDITLTIYPHVGLGFLAAVVGLTVLGTVLAGIYPAWKAARLRPVEALRAT